MYMADCVSEYLNRLIQIFMEEKKYVNIFWGIVRCLYTKLSLKTKGLRERKQGMKPNDTEHSLSSK